MAELRLVDTETGDVEARMVLTPDGTIRVTGPGADGARDILASYTRLLDDDAAAWRYLRDYGWANGPLAIVAADS